MNILIEQTHDMVLVEAILRHPKCWPNVSDDRTPEDWHPQDLPGLYWALAIQGEQPIGVFGLNSENGVMAQAHIAMLPEGRGKVAKAATEAFFRWVWAETPFQKVMGMIARRNSPARSLVCQAGMNRQGLLPRAFLKNGKLHDLMVYGIEKPQEVAA